MSFSAFIRLALTFIVMAASLAACAAPQPGGRASAAALAACRQRADETYLRQNRTALYDADRFATSTRDSPFAGAGLPGNASTGLSGRFERENMVSDCLRGSAAGADAATVSGGAATTPTSSGPITPGMKALPPPKP